MIVTTPKKSIKKRLWTTTAKVTTKNPRFSFTQLAESRWIVIKRDHPHSAYVFVYEMFKWRWTDGLTAAAVGQCGRCVVAIRPQFATVDTSTKKLAQSESVLLSVVW